jgi:hypothetical protein
VLDMTANELLRELPANDGQVHLFAPLEAHTM